MAKRKTKQKNTRKKTKKFSLEYKIIFFLIAFILSILAGGLYLYSTGAIRFTQETHKKETLEKTPIKSQELIKKMEVFLSKKKDIAEQDIQQATQKVKKRLAKKSKIDNNNTNTTIKETPVFPTISDALMEQKPTEVEDYLQSSQKALRKKSQKVKKSRYFGKPKLAIIIDDVSFKAQVNGIKKIPFKVTPSFLPPTKRHPNTPKLAKSFPYYMVHLPLEAIKHSHPESKTLKKGESYKNIHSWIKKIKNDFPKAKYYNNHTGSKFTADTKSMDRLYLALQKENLLFLDSKTTPFSKAKNIAAKYHLPLYTRDVFLDNSFEEKSIKKQLKEAIRIAKIRGYAIAICHPHKSTLKVLRNAKPLLKDVELVYINGIQ